MFAQYLLDKREILSAAWSSGNHMSLPRSQILSIKIEGVVEAIAYPKYPLSLRVAGICLEGVANIHHEQVVNILRRLQAFRFGIQEMPSIRLLHIEPITARCITLPKADELINISARLHAEWMAARSTLQEDPVYREGDSSHQRKKPRLGEESGSRLEDIQRLRYLEDNENHYPTYDLDDPGDSQLGKLGDLPNFGEMIFNGNDSFNPDMFSEHTADGSFLDDFDLGNADELERGGTSPPFENTSTSLVEEIQALLNQSGEMEPRNEPPVVNRKRGLVSTFSKNNNTQISSTTYKQWQSNRTPTMTKRARVMGVSHVSPSASSALESVSGSVLGRMWTSMVNLRQKIGRATS